MKSIFHEFGKHGLGAVKSLLDINLSKDFKIEDVIIICGVPRSGTSWLMEILETLPEYKSYFEPLNYRWFPELKKIKQYSNYFLKPTEECNELENYLSKIFTGGVKNTRAHYRLNFKNLLKRYRASKIMVKFVKANRLLPWISSKFKVREIFLITRHPFAVISSQINTGIIGYYYLEDTNRTLNNKIILSEIKKYEFEVEKIKRKIKNINDFVGLLACNYALNYYIPLNSPHCSEINILRYEDILYNYKKNITKIFEDVLESNYTDGLINIKTIPSISTRKNDIIDNKKWKKYLNESDINRVIEILTWFNIKVDSEDYMIS